MVQKLEAIKGGGGSIRVGTTGTISALMTRELDNTKPAPATSVQCRDKPRTIAVSVPCGATTPRRLQARKSLDEASSSGAGISRNYRSPEATRKIKSFPKNTHRVPMLASQGATLEKTPSREKPVKRGTINIVQIVDIKCGNPNRPWGTTPITTKLKKLGFSKLSESMA